MPMSTHSELLLLQFSTRLTLSTTYEVHLLHSSAHAVSARLQVAPEDITADKTADVDGPTQHPPILVPVNPSLMYGGPNYLSPQQ